MLHLRKSTGLFRKRFRIWSMQERVLSKCKLAGVVVHFIRINVLFYLLYADKFETGNCSSCDGKIITVLVK